MILSIDELCLHAERALRRHRGQPDANLATLLTVEAGALVLHRPNRELRLPDDLLLLAAHPSWSAFGILTFAHANRGSHCTEHVRLAHLVGADGATVTLIDTNRRGAAPERLWALESSRLDDACRRVLDLPTSPPPPGAAFIDLVWLDLIMSAVQDRPDGPPPTWHELVLLHPCGLTVDHSQHTDGHWAALRRAVVTGRIEIDLCPPDLAAWMDDGYFARHLIEVLPEPDCLLGDLVDLLTPSTFHRLTLVLLERCRAA